MMTLGCTSATVARQVGRALRHLGGPGVAVGRRAALEHVGDVGALSALAGAAQTHGAQHVAEQLTRSTHKRLALQVFVFTGGFAHDEPVGLRAAGAKHGVLAPFAQAAGLATRHGFAQRRPVHQLDTRRERCESCRRNRRWCCGLGRGG